MEGQRRRTRNEAEARYSASLIPDQRPHPSKTMKILYRIFNSNLVVGKYKDAYACSLAAASAGYPMFSWNGTVYAVAGPNHKALDFELFELAEITGDWD